MSLLTTATCGLPLMKINFNHVSYLKLKKLSLADDAWAPESQMHGEYYCRKKVIIDIFDLKIEKGKIYGDC